jgi:hypothetical protein
MKTAVVSTVLLGVTGLCRLVSLVNIVSGSDDQGNTWIGEDKVGSDSRANSSKDLDI